ncbi:PAS fold family (fragment) [Planktothrix serta PCC 8927]|uniref:Circadian input-output histidine kinase CikA n=1 Tax=Planktothrix serta PCC 8927 TaxID=671068 RepID=A0A7Z9DY64_9CYAN
MPHPHVTILLLDDSTEDRVAYRRYLQSDPHYSYTIIDANSAEIALEYCRKSPPDLMLLDYLLSDMDGLEFLEQLQQFIPIPTLPILMITGQGNENVAVQALKNGVKDYIIKDQITCDDLCHRVHLVLEQIFLVRQIQQQQEQQQLVANVALRILQFLNLDDILTTAVAEVSRCLKADRVVVYQFLPLGGGRIIAESVLPSWSSCLGLYLGSHCFPEEQKQQYRHRKQRGIANIYQAELANCHIELLEEWQIKSSLITPILLNDDNEPISTSKVHLWGLLIVHQCANFRKWTEGEFNVLRGIGVQLAIAIRHGELYDQAQKELQKRQKIEQALTQERNFISAVLGSVAALIIVLDRQGRIVRFNQACEQLTEYSTQELEGKYFWDFLILPEEQQQIRVVFQNLCKGECSDRHDNYWVTKRGNRRLISWSNTILSDQHGEIEYIIATGLDITEREQIEAELRSLNQQLEDRVQGRTLALQYTNERLQQEISDRKEAEQELLEQKSFLYRIIDANPSWIFVTNLQGKVLLVNETMARFYSKKISDIIHKKLDEIPAPIQQNSSQQMSPLFTAQIPEETRQNFELSMITTTGEERYFQGVKFLLTDAEGQVKGRLGIVSDITERQLIENALQQQIEREQLLNTVTQRLRESLNLQDILNKAANETYKILQSDRMLIYQIMEDNRGKVIAETCSPGCICLFDHVFDMETFPVSCYQQYRQGKIYNLADRSLKTEPICLQEFMETYQIQAKLVVPIVQNDRLWGLLVAHQCFQPRQWQPWEINLLQQLASQLAIAIQQSELYQKLKIELKERQETELQLQTTNEQLKLTNQALAQATRLKDEFLANMSHELRTPLNAILGMSEGLLEEVYGSLTEKQRRSLTIVQRSGQHLLELINDILDLAKIESGQVKLEMSAVSLYQLCDYSLAFIRPQAHKKRMQLITELLPKDCIVFLDQRQIRQVLINLLSNAVKFTPEGEKITLRVRIESNPKTPEACPNLDVSEMLVFEVEDRGIGIAPSDQDKLFQSFVQLDNRLSRTHSGTGLGLAMVRRITELHQGCVSVSSNLDQGSCFTVKIPYRTSQLPGEDLAIVAGSPLRTLGLRDIHPPPTISLANSPLVLLAEDNESNIIMVSEYLDCKGYRVLVAKNGLEAIEITQQQRPELILMDISMPEMDGLTAICQIRANSEIATIPIIALTALAMPGDEERCLAVGANAYLTKPIRLVKLLETIQNLLSIKRS